MTKGQVNATAHSQVTTRRLFTRSGKVCLRGRINIFSVVNTLWKKFSGSGYGYPPSFMRSQYCPVQSSSFAY